MATNDDLAVAAALARGITDKAAKENRTGQLLPATVVNYGTAQGFTGSYAEVHIVGDPVERILQVPVLVPAPLSAGDMVMVMFDPPEGAYVWSVVAGSTVHSAKATMACGTSG